MGDIGGVEGGGVVGIKAFRQRHVEEPSHKPVFVPIEK